MRVLVLVCVAAAVFPWTAAAQEIPISEYAARRESLREALDGGVFLLIGATEDPEGDFLERFSQEPNFYYLTGWTQAGAILAVGPEKDVLFLPARDPMRDLWTGRKLSADDDRATETTGFDAVQPSDAFPDWIEGNAESWPSVSTLLDQSGRVEIEKLLPGRTIEDASLILARLRSIKSPAEQALLRRSARITVEAHREAWKRLRPGLFEYQIAATMTGFVLEAGCDGTAYPPIVASGENSVILHYFDLSRRIGPGDVVLMDVGAECSGYAADVTRTLPADGEFTERQRELYEIVLGARDAVIAQVKPGMFLGKHGRDSLDDLAMGYFRRRGLAKYFTHSIGHHVGLEVHDPADPNQPLAPGMVITVEPGVYLPEEAIGIRIEEMVLVTEDGAVVLTSELPSEPAAIEQALARSN